MMPRQFGDKRRRAPPFPPARKTRQPIDKPILTVILDSDLDLLGEHSCSVPYSYPPLTRSPSPGIAAAKENSQKAKNGRAPEEAKFT
jgi:hypothetical protein